MGEAKSNSVFSGRTVALLCSVLWFTLLPLTDLKAQPYMESGGICVMEAENANISQRSDSLIWQVGTTTPGYAGTGYAYTTNSGTTSTWTNATELAWTVQIQTAGTYYMAVRRVAPDLSSDTMFKGVDGTDKNSFVSGLASQWTWASDIIYSLGSLSVGQHTIQIRRNEDGFQIDRVAIADSVGKLPSGTEVGPAESPRGTDSTPPTPSPMTWQTQPHAVDSSTASMTATTASDPSGVEYFFDETSGNAGGTDSGWQDSTTYVDSGLTAGLTYSYRVKARDKSTNHNETGWSSTVQVTPPTGDSTPPTPSPMTWQTQPYVVDGSTASMTARGIVKCCG